MNLKTVLESKLGEISDEALNFAMEYSNNSNEQGLVYKSESEMLDHYSMAIEFYYRHVEKRLNGNDMRKKFIFREVTRDGGNLELAYNVSRESLILELRQAVKL